MECVSFYCWFSILLFIFQTSNEKTKRFHLAGGLTFLKKILTIEFIINFELIDLPYECVQ